MKLKIKSNNPSLFHSVLMYPFFCSTLQTKNFSSRFSRKGLWILAILKTGSLLIKHCNKKSSSQVVRESHAYQSDRKSIFKSCTSDVFKYDSSKVSHTLHWPRRNVIVIVIARQLCGLQVTRRCSPSSHARNPIRGTCLYLAGCGS